MQIKQIFLEYHNSSYMHKSYEYSDSCSEK